MHCGLPEKILSDQQYNFESRLMAELCEISKVKKLCTTPFRPQCNGQYEHCNATLISMIGTLPTEAKINWQEQLPKLVHAYNCSHSNATGLQSFLFDVWETAHVTSPCTFWCINTKYSCLYIK